MTKEDMIALGIPKDRMKDFRTRYFADVKKAAQRLNKSSEQSTDDVKKAIAALVQVIDDPETLHLILSYVASTRGRRRVIADAGKSQDQLHPGRGSENNPA